MYKTAPLSSNSADSVTNQSDDLPSYLSFVKDNTSTTNNSQPQQQWDNNQALPSYITGNRDTTTTVPITEIDDDEETICITPQRAKRPPLASIFDPQ